MAEELNILRERAGHLRRSPDWRWRLACRINDNPKRRFRGVEGDDEHIEAARAIQLIYREQQSADEMAEQLASLGDAAEAYSFWTENAEILEADKAASIGLKEYMQPLSMGASLTAQIEAYILSGATSEEIGKYIPLKAGAIDAYERIFFDVRDRLSYPTWIAAHAIGPLQQVGPLTLIPNLVRAYGYYSRSIAIAHQVATTFNEEALQRNAKDSDRFFGADLRSTNSMRAALAMRMVNFNYKTFEKIIELHNEGVETDAKIQANQTTAAEEQFMEAIGIVSSQIRWGYGEAPTNMAEHRMLVESGLKVVSSNDTAG